MSDTGVKELPKGYEPKDVEEARRAFWEADKTFTPSPEAPGEAYAIVIPPPNVTGNLHIGHALNLTLQDVLCRHARQLGKNVLWVPGEDHAGIATQNVVERRLKAEGKSRHDLGREAFVERVWQWKEEYGENIRRQIKAMGASVDWSRERFTLDEGLSRAVRRVFVRLHNEELIYKGRYIVNWCTRCHTALPMTRSSTPRRRPTSGISATPWKTARANWSSPPPGRRPCSATRPCACTPKTNATPPLWAKRSACL